MAGRPKNIRCIQSLINNIDNNTDAGPMKMGTAPSVGVTRNYWNNYQRDCNTTANKPKKSYNNMVFLNINPAQTPVSCGFTQSTNYNYSYIPNHPYPNYLTDYNKNYHNHYYRPYLPKQQQQIVVSQDIVNKYNSLLQTYLSSKYK